MKQDEFDRYLENLVQKAKRLNKIEGVFEKPDFRALCWGFWPAIKSIHLRVSMWRRSSIPR